MPDDSDKPPSLTFSLTVLEFAELQAAVTIGLRISGLEGVELNKAMAAACAAVIAHRASTSPRLRPKLRVVTQDEPLGAA